MLISGRNILRLNTLLYILVFLLLVVPWAYYQEAQVDYTFIPRKIIFILMAIVAFLMILTQKVTIKKILIWLGFLVLGVLHWKINGYNEPHYAFQFIYYEIATLIIFAPTAVKERMLKFTPYVLYILLAKAFYFRIGSYVHGGFLSSNLFATYIVFLCFIEVYKKRYWNLIPSILVLYFVGSKAAYMAMALMLVFVAVSYLEGSNKFKNIFSKNLNFSILRKSNFYWSVFIAAFSILIFTKIMVRTDYYHAWSEKMAPSKAETVKNNMIMYGIDKSEKSEKQRELLLVTKEEQFKNREISITQKPLITDIGISVGLRLVQYDYMYSNMIKYFLVGDTIESQKEMFGNNPHSAFVDIVSRLGLLYFILILLFYSQVFKFMDLLMCNICLIPILAFQPYGFTIGHSIVILSMVYALSKVAKHQSATN